MLRYVPVVVALLPTIALYTLVLSLTLYVLLPVSLRLLVLPSHIRIGHFTLWSLSHLSWVGPAPSPDGNRDTDGLRISVDRVALVRWRGGTAAARARAKLHHLAQSAKAGVKGAAGAGPSERSGRANLETDRDKGRAWFVVRLEGVRVRVPKALALAIPPKREASQKAQPQRAPPPAQAGEPKKAAGGFLSALKARLSPLLVLFALQIDFSLEVEEVAAFSGTICAGGSLTAARGAPDEQEARAWVRLNNFRIIELAGSTSSSSSPASPPPAPLPAIEMPDPLVVRVAAPLVRHCPAVSSTASDSCTAAAAPSWALRERGVRVAVEFGGSEHVSFAPAGASSVPHRAAAGAAQHGARKRPRRRSSLLRAQEAEEACAPGVHIRVHELKRVLGRVGELMAQKEARRCEARGEAEPAEQRDEVQDEREHEHEPKKDKPSPLVFLRSLALQVPSVVLSAHYTTPDSILASASASTASALPRTIAFALTLRGARAELKLGEGTEGVRKEHREWLAGGSSEDAWCIGAEWKEIEGKVKADGAEEDVLLDASKALSIGPSRVDLSSTWLPPPLAPAPHASIRSHNLPTHVPVNHSDAVVIAELFLGEVRGHAPFETLDAALRIFKARPRPAAPPACSSRKERRPSASADGRNSKTIAGLPRIVGSLVAAGIELRVQGPRPTSVPSPDPSASGDPDDPFFRSWSAPELLCLSFPSGQVSFGGEWTERSVKRSEADRRAARRALKHRRNASRSASRARDKRDDDDDDDDSETGRREDEDDPARHRDDARPTRTFEEEYGVPPPPPLHEDYSKRRFKPLKPIPNLTKDLDRFGLEYQTRLSLTADTLNVYILGTNHEPHEHDYPESDDDWDEGTRYGMPALPSDPVRLDILALGPLELSSAVRILGDERQDLAKGVDVPFVDLAHCRGEHGVLLETIEIDLWRPAVMGCLRDLLSAAAFAAATSTRPKRGERRLTPAPEPAPPLVPLVDLLPADQNLYIALASFDLRIAGTDPKADAHSCRGVALHSGPLVAQYLLQSEHEPGLTGNFAERSSLNLTEDIRVEANATANPAPPVLGGPVERPRVALAKLSVLDFSIDPVVDARASRGRKRFAARGDGEGESDGEEDWEIRGRAEMADLTKRRKSIIPPRFSPKTARSKEEAEVGRGLVLVPHLALRLRVQRAPEIDAVDDADDAAAEEHPPAALDEIILTVASEVLTLRIELFSIYLCLVAISSMRSLRTRLGDNPVEKTAAPVPSAHAKRKRPAPLFRASGDVGDIHLFPTLPHDTHVFITFRRILFQHTKLSGVVVEWEKAILAGQSPTVPGKWEEIVSLRGGQFRLRPDPNNDGYHPFVIALACDTARLRIPFRYVFSRIIDNTASLIKATKQLVYEHVKGGTKIIIEPGPEEAKRVPQVELRIGLFALEMQDDPFETKLNIIWRAGYEEQNARLERERAFQDKVEAIRRAERSVGDEEPDSASEDDDRMFASRKKTKLNGKHTIDVQEAERDLLAFNSSHWIKRIRNAGAEQTRREEALTRRLYGGRERNGRAHTRLPVDVLPISRSAPLARGTFHNVSFVVTRPSFADNQLGDFLHDVGKGLPRDTVFSLLVPLHISWKMDEARFQLRDYPLPLLHVPRNNRHDVPSWVCEFDLVIAEEVSGPEAVRRVPCAVIPQHVFEGMGAPYTIVVPRSAMPVKTYATPTVRITTSEPMRIGWGNAVQPAIQDVARVVDTLTKASPDPSDRIGFWDKIRLQLHWRVQLLFPGAHSSVIFHLKGTRDPYSLVGFGAGFAKAWKGNVQFRLGLENPDHEFFQVLSDQYVLGIPNLRDYVDAAATGLSTSEGQDGTGGPLGGAFAAGTDGVSAYAASTVGGDEYDTASHVTAEDDDISYWIKVCAKCVNGVRWGMGIRLERTCRDESCDKPTCTGMSTFHRQCRIFDFIPHWHVHTKTAAAIGPHGEISDSFAGFRSDFVHFSLSLTSPANLELPARERNSPVAEANHHVEAGSNSFHFTPHAMTHFHRWWKTFDGCMSLPIRQGKLFPRAQAPSPKFGRHTATIKYRFSLAPLFIAHTYRQDTWAEWSRGETTVLGMKGKIGRFNVDLHQRTQEMVIRRDEMSESKTVKHKAFYMAEVDMDVLDLRCISALFQEPIKAQVAPADADADEEANPPPVYESYGASSEDQAWIDYNDFHDAIYTMPLEEEPAIRILPFMVCPRFTYYRHKDAAPTKDADDEVPPEDERSTPPERPKSKFGNELSHICLMGCATDTVTVQIEEAENRLLAQSDDQVRSDEIDLRIRAVRRIVERLCKVRDEASQASQRPDSDSHVDQNHWRSPPTPATPATLEEDSGDSSSFPHLTNTLFEEWGQWENRYMIHNPSVQVSNAIREILLKYYYSSRDRKGFVYHASASVLRFIRDLAKDHERKQKRDWSRRKSTRTGGSTSAKRSGAFQDSEQTNRLLDELAKRGGGMWATNEEQQTDDDRQHFGDHLEVDPYLAAAALPEEYDANSGHLCMFIKPQVSLQSDVDDRSTLIIAAFRAQVKVFQVLDTRIVDDPVNAEVLHQTFARLDGLQVFYPRQQVARRDRTFAQAFVPLETLVDLRVEPWGFDRVVSRTSAAMRYDKFNQLRLSSKRGFADGGLGSGGPASHFHTATDRVSFEAEKFSLSANPAHFAAIYNVVTDLILYSDPLRKSRNSKVEALVFTRDFSNLRSVMETVGGLQQQIRAIAGLAQQFQLHIDELDDEGHVELFLGRAEAVRLAHELSLVVEAFTRAQESNGPKTTSKRAGLQLESRAAELTWHMLDKEDLPFAKFSVIGAEFSWVSKQDGSASNRMVIKDLRALNSSPEQIFAEIVAKADVGDADNQLAKMDVFAAAVWNSLAPVGGISIIERFELHLHPVRLQLEHRMGRKIVDYLFSERHQRSAPTSTPPQSSPRKSSSPLTGPGTNARASRSTESLLPPRTSYASTGDRTLASSSASIRSTEHRLRKAISSDMLVADVREEGLDADEMRHRAASNATFIFVEISSTLLCLTYRSEKEDKSSLPNIYNITYSTPLIQYRSKTWSFLDMLDELKRAAVAPGAMAAAPVAKHEDPLHGDVDQLTESPRSSMQHDSPRLSHSSSRSYSSAEDEQLPFDIAAAELVHPEVELEHHVGEGIGETYEPFSQATQQREAVEAAGGDRNSPVMVAEPDSIDDQEHAVEERARHDQHERESRDALVLVTAFDDVALE
ncbi:hypothetical protein Rhopal_007614-T1 [Rhodotorula paludigena]|uniref:Golgi-body localization protein domain-containing protein n=1 Tax=Rhodotorula paludigena TaxID=86838 RepID=A0AAV5GPL2_9BASI|nr:hypothetical protein Rhopal_007614-T1 [Rhodotorula paludigena]